MHAKTFAHTKAHRYSNPMVNVTNAMSVDGERGMVGG